MLGLFDGILDSVVAAERAGEFLSWHQRSQSPLVARLELFGSHGKAVAGGAAGFIVNALLHAAMVDIRKTLDFFGIGKARQGNRFTPKSVSGDDLSPSSLGLKSRMTARLLCKRYKSESPKPLRKHLLSVLRMANKSSAHLTTKFHPVLFEDIIISCRVIRRLIIDEIYLPLGRTVPSHIVRVAQNEG